MENIDEEDLHICCRKDIKRKYLQKWGTSKEIWFNAVTFIPGYDLWR